MADPRLRVRDVLRDGDVPIDRSPFTIGRRESNCLRLGGSEVSREHAVITRDGSRYLLQDRQSRYGTFVNGAQITEWDLRSGDQIRLGRSGGADLVFFSDTEETTPSAGSRTDARDGLRQIVHVLERLRALGSGRLLQEVLALVLDAALEASRAERGFIMLAAADGSLEFRLGRNNTGETLTDRTFSTSRKIPEEVFTTGKPQVVRDLLEEDAGEHPATKAFGIRSVVCIPLNPVQYMEPGDAAAEHRRIGVLYLDTRARGMLVSPATTSALESLAAEASVAIENARLYREKVEKMRMDHEMRVAAEIQQALLPLPVTRLPYLEAAAATIPCRSIGGDFYDYLRQAGDVFSFTLGDVAGKGPPAALMSAVMQGMFAYASQEPPAGDPAVVVSSINRALCKRSLESRFVTFVLGAISADGRLTYCNAGHNPPLVVHGAAVRRLDVGGPIVGLLEFAAFDQDTIALEPGDAIVLFSDGVSEALNAAGEEFGETRLCEAIRQTGTASAEALVDGVVAAVRRFTEGAAQSDDITVMAIRYFGSSEQG